MLRPKFLTLLHREKISWRNTISHFGSILLCWGQEQHTAQLLLNPAHFTGTREIKELPLPSPLSNSELFCQQELLPWQTTYFLLFSVDVKGEHGTRHSLWPGSPLFKLYPASVCIKNVRVNRKGCTFGGKQKLPSIEIKSMNTFLVGTFFPDFENTKIYHFCQLIPNQTVKSVVYSCWLGCSDGCTLTYFSWSV